MWMRIASIQYKCHEINALIYVKGLETLSISFTQDKQDFPPFLKLYVWSTRGIFPQTKRVFYASKSEGAQVKKTHFQL